MGDIEKETFFPVVNNDVHGSERGVCRRECLRLSFRVSPSCNTPLAIWADSAGGVAFRVHMRARLSF